MRRPVRLLLAATGLVVGAAVAAVAGAASTAVPPGSVPSLTPALASSLLVIVLLARSRGTIGQYGTHRLTEAGEDWRSLLLGAPPGR